MRGSRDIHFVGTGYKHDGVISALLVEGTNPEVANPDLGSPEQQVSMASSLAPFSSSSLWSKWVRHR